MHAIALWMALVAQPFWEAKPPHDWTDAELQRMLTDSPWAQQIDGGTSVILATARPIVEAEREWARRSRTATQDTDPEYTDFLAGDGGKHIVVAIRYSDLKKLADAGEVRKMEEESILKAGKKKYKMAGHFSPTPSDPYLRLIYPREIGPNDKSLVLELYLPGISLGYHIVEFRLKELTYRGATEM